MHFPQVGAGDTAICALAGHPEPRPSKPVLFKAAVGAHNTGMLILLHFL
ncbi:MAG: hypothetical protein IPG34_01955 [Rhodocyclaceae bacterium]|nr:hypothetical protein [Rhodocyclaceae bacterium]